jgi:hypothetical protein
MLSSESFSSVSTILLGKGARRPDKGESPLGEMAHHEIEKSTAYNDSTRKLPHLSFSTEMASQLVSTVTATLSSGASRIASRRSEQLTDAELCLAEQGLFRIDSDLSASSSDDDSAFQLQSEKILNKLKHTTSRTASTVANATLYRQHNLTRFS